MSLHVHRFYFKNFPSKIVRDGFSPDRRSHKFLPIPLAHTFLKDNKNTIFIYTGNSNIKIPKYITMNLDAKSIKKLNKSGLEIYLYEPLCCYIKNNHHNRSFYSEFSSTDNLSDIRSTELDSIQEFVNNYNLTNVSVYTCDYDVETYLGPHYTFNVYCKDLFLSDVSQDFRFSPTKNIIKPFWCANGRYTQHRHLVMSYLANFSGNYTWHYNSQIDPLMDTTWIEAHKLSNRAIERITTGDRLLKSNNFFIDQNLEKESVVRTDGVYIPEFTDGPTRLEFLYSYGDCFLGVINESRYAQPTANISEKLYHCVITKTPFILVAPAHSLKYIKKLGFKTFDKFWSEEYDTIEDPTERLNEIFSLLENINNKSIDELRDMYNEMHDIIEHNYNTLLTLKNFHISSK